MMQTRRDFILGAAGAAGVVASGCAGLGKVSNRRLLPPRMMWAYLAQFGIKLWERRKHYTDLKVDESMWKSMTERAGEIGVNVFVFDLAEGMVFPSHPELAVKGSWEPERMKNEIARLKKMGMMAVPKLNFSSSHDQWLGKWNRYLSTPEYFEVCSEIIKDVADVFDESPFFHIGFDEEIFSIQDINKFEYKRLRSGNVWWNDFLWFVREVESHGMRSWIWSDGCWDKPEEFVSRMPRTVLQSNWYYRKQFDVNKLEDRKKGRVETYRTLSKGWFDQVPCGSTHDCRENFELTIEHCRNVIKPDRLKGFLMAPWYGATLEARRDKIMESLDVMGEAIAKWKQV